MRLNHLFLALGLALASCGTPAMASDSPPDKPNATAQVINHAIDKATDAVGQVATAVSKVAPQAWALAVHGTYAQGLATLISGGAVLLASLVSVGFGIWCGCTEKWDNYKVFPKNVFCIILCIVGTALFVVGMGVTFGSDAIVKVISPDGYLAQQILSKAL